MYFISYTSHILKTEARLGFHALGRVKNKCPKKKIISLFYVSKFNIVEPKNSSTIPFLRPPQRYIVSEENSGHV